MGCRRGSLVGIVAVAGGEKTLKIYESRIATEEEVARGITYVSPRDGKTKVRVLRSINPDYPEIVVTDDVHWLGWLDKKDNLI